MLLVDASMGLSAIHRVGLIAHEFIPTGTIVWRFEPEFDVVISEKKLATLSPPAQAQVRYYAYFHASTRTYVLSSDDDRFTNHSPEPNTRATEICTYAVRDISQGEEITADYAEFEMLNFSPNNVDKP